MSWESWGFALNVTIPGLLMLLLGVVLGRTRFIDEQFNRSASKLVFNIALPCLIFFSLTGSRVSIAEHYDLALYGAISTVASFLLLELAAPFLISERKERGLFVQGGFRSNTAIIGLAYSAIAYGNEGIVLGSIYMATTVILFNVLSIITLTRSLSDETTFNGKRVLIDITKNPLILAITAGVIWSIIDLPIAEPIQRTGAFLSGLTLPLAMICAGASIDLRLMFRKGSNTALYATFSRAILVPFLITLGAYLWGFQGISLGVIFLLTSTPTAAASYVMTQAMGGNATIAANIIALTTVLCFFTSALGLSLLRGAGLI